MREAREGRGWGWGWGLRRGGEVHGMTGIGVIDGPEIWNFMEMTSFFLGDVG